ncbi:MAG TPA: tetratricopeptide repeat protein, partial [Candidatus Atribacteria bacterium]|nr:tetratricopeptide repeat protein [Candidatus Atribacteria bacterium]
YVSLINCYIKLNKIQLAEQILNKSLNRFPENYKLLNLAGIISLLKNDYKYAERYFRQALDINNDDKIINNLGIALYLAGKKKEAKKLLTKIKKYDKIEENIKLIEGGGK